MVFFLSIQHGKLWELQHLLISKSWNFKLFSVLLEKAANINWKAIFTPDFQSLWLNMQKSTKLQT